MIRAHVIDVEIEILNVIEIDGYCERCMTLIYIYVPSRDDNCRLANRQLFVLMILFGLIRPGIIGQLIERK